EGGAGRGGGGAREGDDRSAAPPPRPGRRRRTVIALRCQPPGERATAIMIGAGAVVELLARAAARTTFALVDEAVADRCAPARLPAGWTWHRVQAGEPLKTLAQAESVLRALARAGCDRQSLLLAIGGGTVGDLGGLCASLFLRGIELWQAPTTLLAMVDSAVGGKTAVNLPE